MNDIPEHLQTRLGLGASLLGVDAVVGTRFFDRTNRAEIRLGPLSFEDYMSFIDDSAKRATLRKALKFVSSSAMRFDLRLMLRADAVPEARMARIRLGQGAWLASDSGAPRGDYVLRDFTSDVEGLAA